VAWGTSVEREVHRRVRLTLAAYAYEYGAEQLMTDAEFDAVARDVDLAVDTGRPDLDAWWRANFSPDTGMWVRSHPELSRVASLYQRVRDATKR
jgi:hypothetical protein